MSGGSPKKSCLLMAVQYGVIAALIFTGVVFVIAAAVKWVVS